MKYFFCALQACLGAFLMGLQPTAHAEARNQYVVPNQSYDAQASESELGVNALFVSVALAHELNGPNGRYCSPEIDVFNASNLVVKHLVLRIDYFQKTSKDNNTFVGSTVTRAHQLSPRTLKRETFFVLETGNCNGLSGLARVHFCQKIDNSSCSSNVAFSDAGRVPLRLVSAAEAIDRLAPIPLPPSGSPPAPAPSAR